MGSPPRKGGSAISGFEPGLARRAAPKLLLALTLSLAVLGATEAAMRVFLGVSSVRSGGRQAAFERLREHAFAASGSAEALVLGNSHFGAALPERLSRHVKILNLSSNSQDAEYCTRMLERFAPRMPRLRTVVYLLEPLTPGFRLRDHEYGRSQIFDFETVFGIPPDGVVSLRERLAHATRRLYFIRYHDRFLKFLHAWLASPRPPTPGTGSRREPAPAAEERTAPLLPAGDMEITGRMQARYHFGVLYRPRAAASNLAALLRASRFCRARGLRLAFVTPPYASVYRRHIPAEAARLLAETIEALRRDAGDAFEYLDASALFGDDPLPFSDADHLNATGAARFMEHFMSRLAP